MGCMRARSWVVTVAAGLVLADASIVTLALPELLGALDTTVEGVAAVIAVYTGVLAVVLPFAPSAVRRLGPARVAALGFGVFALASAVCAVADTLAVLLSARAIQAAAGAFALVATFELIRGGTLAGRRHWLAAAVLASAVGPALGGALTQAFDWRAIFVAQVPVALVGALAARRDEPEPLGGRVLTTGFAGGAPPGARTPPYRAAHVHPHGHPPDRPLRRMLLPDALALALVSGALTAVLFGLVLLLIAGWAVEPLAAAVTVTVLPLAAVVGAQVRSEPRIRALAGCLLVGGGVLALAWLPSASVAWTFAPQALAGVGMGMALPAFAGELLPERTAREAARLLTIRHAGIALVLISLAPLIAHRLDVVTERAQEQGVALVLDARLPPQDKLTLAPALLGGVEAERPRAGLERALADNGRDYSGDERATYDTLAKRADDVLVSAVGDAFRIAFVIAGGLALLAAGALTLGAARVVVAPPATGIEGEGAVAPEGEEEAAAALPWEGGDADRAGGAEDARAPAERPVRARPEGHRRRSRWSGPARHGARATAIALAAALAVATPTAYAAIHAATEPQHVAIEDPCEGRALPGTGGISGFLQDRALEALDAAACRFGSSREELVLALANDEAAKRYEAEHGVDPRSARSILGNLINP
jgi:MFS family permease